MPFVSLPVLVVQQILCSTMSVFWGLGIGCMIEFFQNDIDKLVHAFYPLFKTWVQMDYYNLKKLSDMSISIRRFTSERSALSFFFSTFTSFTNIYLYRLIVTENAQCGLWNQWCTQNKKPRNAKISHSENTPKSDAVKFFLHLLNNEPYSQFNFKESLYAHFQRLLSTPEKALLLNDANFATKVNASRRYPSCDIDTAHLFDEEGDPIFVMELNSPTQPSSGVAFDNSKKGPKTNTGLKRTLCTTVPKKKRPRKTVPVAEPVPPPVDAPPAPQQPATLPATQQPEQQPTNKSSLFKNPSKLALPSKIAFPVNNDDKQFLENFSYLPVSQTKGIALFNAFVNYCNNSEQHAVLVSRAFVSSNIRLHGERVAIRQVQ